MEAITAIKQMPLIGKIILASVTIGWHPDGMIDFEIYINKIYFDISHIKYLHQLQNLYFALTGKELTINL